MHAHTHNTNICWKITRKMNFKAGLLNFLWVFFWFSFFPVFFSFCVYIGCTIHGSIPIYLPIMYMMLCMLFCKACLMLSRKINITHQTLYGFDMYGFDMYMIWYGRCGCIIRDVDITSLSGQFLRFTSFFLPMPTWKSNNIQKKKIVNSYTIYTYRDFEHRCIRSWPNFIEIIYVAAKYISENLLKNHIKIKYK